MKLIDDIIGELVDSNVPITDALLKTKVLASMLDIEELKVWVENEINGYPAEAELPEYRKAFGNLIGDYIVGNRYHALQYTGQALPTSGLEKKQIENLESFDLYGGVATLEQNAKDAKAEGVMQRLFPSEVLGYIQNKVRQNGNPEFHLTSAKNVISVSVVSQTLSAIRSRLLDFVLKIKGDFGDIKELESLKSKTDSIKSIMNKTIIKGDGNVVNTGDNAVVSAEIRIVKGDQDSLRSHLISKGIAGDDINELLTVIDLDRHELKKDGPNFPEKVNTWIKKMMGKAVDGAWKVGIEAAGKLLSDALSNYYF